MLDQSVGVDRNRRRPAAHAVDARNALLVVMCQHEGEPVLLANGAEHGALPAAVESDDERGPGAALSVQPLQPAEFLDRWRGPSLPEVEQHAPPDQAAAAD